MSVNRIPVVQAELTVGVVCSLGAGPTRGGRSTNQDNYLVCNQGRVCWRDTDAEAVTFVEPGHSVLLAVADGMGGHEDGDVAAASAVQAVARLFLQPLPSDPESVLRSFLIESHRRIRDRVAEAGEVKMGTTLSVVWVIGNRAWWAHVGDSRIYHWRAGRLTRITRDQTREEFALRDRRATPTHPRYLAQNFIYGSRGLGDDVNIRIDKGLDTGVIGLHPGDRLLLSSDGLHGPVDDMGIADCIANVPEPAPCALALVERAIARDSDDNVTAVVARIDALRSAPGVQEDEGTIVPV